MKYFAIPSHRIAFLFGVVASVLGIIYLIVTPPMQSPDEYNHFYRAWHISQGNLYGQRTIDHRIGGTLPESLPEFNEYYIGLIRCDSCKIDMEHWHNSMEVSMEGSKDAFIDFANTGMYFPVNYLPQVLGIWIGRTLSDSVGFAFYIGRFMNLLFWILIGYLALRIIPVYKELLFFLLLLPSSLAFHMSMNQDVLIHGLGFLLFAFTFRVIFEDSRYRLYYLMVVSLMATVLVMMKPTLWPLMLLVLFLPVSINKKPYWWTWTAVLAVSFIVLLGTSYVSHSLFIPFDEYHVDFREGQTLNPDVNPSHQLDFMLASPFFTLKTFIKSYLQAMPSLIAHYIGKSGWMALYLPGPLVLILLLGIIWSTQINGYRWKHQQRFLLLSIAFLLLSLFSVTMYLLWCPVGNDELWNLQGRYFVLILPLIWISIPRVLPKFRFDQYFGFWVLILILANVYMLFSIILRYWHT